MQIIYLDISSKGVVPTIYAKQGDIGRKIQVIFTDSGIPYKIPENAELSVWYEGDSGAGNYTDIGDKPAIVVENNKVTFELITQMLNNDGEGIVCLIMNVGEEQIGYWNIHYLCEKVPGFDSEGASSYFTAFSESVNKLKDIDKTLTKEGYPADAKATGDKIDNLTAGDIGAAPGDYGLGGVSKQLTSADDLNNIKANGWYQWNDNDKPKNVPTGANTSYLSAMRVTVCGGACLQEIFDVSDSSVRGCSVQRTIYGGLVYEWEWVNPPMIADTEYRTIERYKGNPVYTMLVDFGTLPSNSYRDEEFTNVSVTAIRIECIGNYTGEHTYADLAAVAFVSNVQVMNRKIRITTNVDGASKWNAMVRVWYTKG